MLEERLRIWELILLSAEIGGESGEERKREKKKMGDQQLNLIDN